MGFFCPKLKMHELKIYWGVMCHENGAKIEEELTSQFQTDINNLTNFDSSTQKSLKFAL